MNSFAIASVNALSSLLSHTTSDAPSSGTISSAAAVLPLFVAALVAVALSAGALVAAVFPPLLPLLLPEPHAVMDTAIENAAVRTISFFNSIA
ncbi:hypothetical protein D3C81_1538060 [compost metagenome]